MALIVLKLLFFYDTAMQKTMIQVNDMCKKNAPGHHPRAKSCIIKEEQSFYPRLWA